MVDARPALIAFALGIVSVCWTGTHDPRAADLAKAAPPPRDGSHDFDFEFGTWKTHLRLLRQPLSGSNAWTEYDGTTTVSRILGGRANVAELQVSGPAGRIEGVSLRLYEPATRHWTLNFASIRDGRLTAPVIGSFQDGRGTFYGKDSLDGREILVRFSILPRTADSIRFEQSFSADQGRTWELNWVAEDVRVKG